MNKITPLLIIAATLFGCGNKQTSEQAQSTATASETTVTLSEAQLNLAKLSIGSFENKNVSSILKVNGVIDVPPQNMVSISVPLGGFLKSTILLPGMHVNKGEVIATMEDQEYITLQENYLNAFNQLGVIENEFARQKELNQSKASSDKVFQVAESNFKNQKITVRALSEKLKLIGINPQTLNENTLSRSITITSPINGFVSAVNVNIGKYVNPSDVLFELVNPDDIHLNLTVFEKDLDKLFIGQKLMTYTNNHPEKKYPCEIILIGKELSKERNVEVHCHFEAYDKFLIPGMFMNADIEINNNKAWVLPDEAIVRFENKHYIFIATSKKTFEMQEVNTGNHENGFTEVVADEQILSKSIVTKGAYALLMKLKNKEEE